MNTIRASLVQLWSTPSRTADENRIHCLEMAREAASSKPDIVVLPEAVSMLCMPDDKPGFSYHDVAESVPGETTHALASIASKFKTNIVCGLIRDLGETCQNLAVVINRKGEIVGTYYKVHEPDICRNEQAADVGDDIPVFDLDFGRVGIMICWDLISPEIPAILSLKGADIILFPHLIGLPTARNFSVQIRARAIDSGIPILAAGMRDDSTHTGSQDGLYPTCAIDASGNLIAQSSRSDSDIINVDVDISRSGDAPRRVAASNGDRRPGVYSREYEKLRRDLGRD